ncbi:MAG: TonB-dependent receptor [Ignavibacteriales bacterium]|nr:MAG: TonB-dependent receptor [Ignavibacteriales bacterium]
MRILVILFLFLCSELFPQNFIIKGKVLDDETSLPLNFANIRLASDKNTGTATNVDGSFALSVKGLDEDSIIVSYLGYNISIIPVTLLTDEIIEIRLQPKVLSSQSVLVRGSIGRKGESPFAYDKVTKSEIKKNYQVQDIPEYLSKLPSSIFYSESGNGIGYNYLSIRGFDQRRITVAINGIPQNDPEDHNVYWVDFPDLLANSDLIQVQRGSGSGLFGYPAIGGAINILTSSYTANPTADVSMSVGSFNTRKYSASFSSGLINQKYSFMGKLSRILSSGYREKAFVKFSSYYFSVSRFDDDVITQLNFYGGPIEDGLAYTGLPKFAINKKQLRRANYSYWEADNNSYTYSLVRRPDEIENFSQPHFELLNEINITNDITLNTALFLVIGQGFFDYDASWADTTYFRLTRQYGFNPAGNPGNALIRAQVENVQYGFIPRVNYKHRNGELIFGGEVRLHKSDHWGSINYGENLPAGLTKDYRYYFYNGGKDIINGFINENYVINEKLNLLGEVQVAYHKYRIENERYVGNKFSISDVFINPRFGINYRVDDTRQLYFSFARVTREPRLKNYYDAAESSGGALPQFESTVDTAGNIISFDYNSPLVKPETMNDFEIGGSISTSKYNLSVNIFLMLFENEIIKNGQLDRFGQPVTGNVEQSEHRGIEVSLLYKANKNVTLFGNTTYSLNRIKDGKDFFSSTDFIDLNNNRISGFPDYLANLGLLLEYDDYLLRIDAKYVGDFYSDNYDENLTEYLVVYPDLVDYKDNVNDSYFVVNVFVSHSFRFFNSLSSSKIFLQVNNVMDVLYSSNAIGKEFFPAAERNFIGGIQISL